jgi:large subunit ribosomal protein L4
MATATTTAKSPTLDKSVFEVEVKDQTLLHQAYVSYLANGRQADAKTLTRGLVRGGGKKPWRQKGTGRARHGSIRSPIWTGGGVTFGPTGQENHTKKLPLKAKRLAIRQALSLKHQAKGVVVAADFNPNEGKTKEAEKYLSQHQPAKRLLLVVESKTNEITRASRNLPGLEVIQPKYLNVFRVMNADKVVITNSALKVINEWLGAK